MRLQCRACIAPYSQSSLPSQTVPNYPPPSQPAPYVAPYTRLWRAAVCPTRASAVPYNAHVQTPTRMATARRLTGPASRARRCSRIRVKARRRCRRCSRLSNSSITAAYPHRRYRPTGAPTAGALSHSRTVMRPRPGRCRRRRARHRPMPLSMRSRLPDYGDRHGARPARSRAASKSHTTTRSEGRSTGLCAGALWAALWPAGYAQQPYYGQQPYPQQQGTGIPRRPAGYGQQRYSNR